MSQALRQRGEEFLKREVPQEINYAPNSITELFIARYVSGDEDFDAEERELLKLCASESSKAAKRHKTTEAKAYFAECATITEAILAELGKSA